MKSKKEIIVSVIIPTFNSGWIIKTALRGLKNQSCSRDVFEIIVVDNKSQDDTIEIVKSYGGRVISVNGKAPQVCKQRNIGIKHALGKYVLILDHDVELDRNLIKNFINRIKTNQVNMDGWFLPYKNYASSKTLTMIRNFEDDIYFKSVVAAARLIKKEFIIKHDIKFDEKLSSGPADWDFNIQLKLEGAKFGYLDDSVFHHEENLSFWKYTTKKSVYIKGGEIYKKKWMTNNFEIYNKIVKKQYSPIYRLFLIFFTRDNFPKLIQNLHIYILFLATKLIMIGYYYKKYLNIKYE